MKDGCSREPVGDNSAPSPAPLLGHRNHLLERRGYRLVQTNYAPHLKCLAEDETFETSHAIRHQVAWIYETRPNVVSVVNICSQATPDTFVKGHVKLLIACVAYAYVTPPIGLHTYHLDMISFRIVVCADASFVNIQDHSTQLEYILQLTDAAARADPTHFSIYKSEQVVNRVLGSVIYTLDDAGDPSFVLKQDLEA